MGVKIDLTGQIFGRLVVLNDVGINNGGMYRWLCICECGKQVIILSHNLRLGISKSCGCLRKEITKQHSLKHGEYKSPAYKSWVNMKQRCNNPNATGYKNWGGRGIKVCKHWEQFENFYADMGDRPEGMSIERINNNKGYSLSNCKWATPIEQRKNRRPYTKKELTDGL